MDVAEIWNKGIIIPSLRATFRNNVQNPLHVYKKNEVILLISPLQPYYNHPEKFNAIIQLINQSKFKKCHIVVGDTNYQHTLNINIKNSEECYRLAEKFGSEWIHTYQHIISKLTVEYTVTRWEHWVQHERYPYHRNNLDQRYHSDVDFQESFRLTAIEFIERNQEQFEVNETNYEHAMDCCLEYLKEECAVIMPLWAELKYPLIIYPTKMLHAMEETYLKLVVPHYSIKPHWLSLRFNTKLPSKEIEKDLLC